MASESMTMPTEAAVDSPPQSKSELAYTWIRDRIIRGQFTPGYRLVLGTIAKQLDISAVPVREAVRRLEAEGLVTFERNVGAHVAMVDERQYQYAMETLAIVEGAAIGLSAPLLTAEDIAVARSVNDRMQASLTDFDPHAFTQLNYEFHTILFSRCPNPDLLDLVRRGWARLSQLRDSTFAFVPGRSPQSVAEHEHILQLIESGADPVEVDLASRRHRTKTLAAYLEKTPG